MRKRFNASERETFVMDARVEWRNVSRWGNYGTVVGPIKRDASGVETIPVRDEKATRTGSGPVHDVVDMRPTTIRACV